MLKGITTPFAVIGVVVLDIKEKRRFKKCHNRPLNDFTNHESVTPRRERPMDSTSIILSW